MLRHHLPLADEIIVNEGLSDDGTFEAISALDPKIQVHRYHWDESDPEQLEPQIQEPGWKLSRETGASCSTVTSSFRSGSSRGCAHFSEQTDKTLVAVRFVHFYGNYKVYLAKRRDIVPETGWRIHRNIPEVEAWGDGANVRVQGQPTKTCPSESRPSRSIISVTSDIQPGSGRSGASRPSATRRRIPNGTRCRRLSST